MRYLGNELEDIRVEGRVVACYHKWYCYVTGLSFPNGIQFARNRLVNLENLSWSHWCLLMRLDDDAEREYYITETSGQNWSVKALERNIRNGYCRQLRISTETSHFYIDLVFYNYLLKCFVIIDLKTTKLSPQDVGQMEMYVRIFDALKRGQDDDPTMGIILCAEKDETVVKYSVLKESKQIFASKYRTILPTENQLAAMIEKKNARLLVGVMS